MKHSNEEILNALQTIMDVCLGQPACENCPLYAHHGEAQWHCVVRMDCPDKWELSDTPEIWRAKARLERSKRNKERGRKWHLILKKL